MPHIAPVGGRLDADAATIVITPTRIVSWGLGGERTAPTVPVTPTPYRT